MQYLLLLANAPEAWDIDVVEHDMDDAEAGDQGAGGVIDDWSAYTRALHEAGVLVGGAALHGPETATSVQVRGGHRLLVDGPFSETKEHLIGFYLIDVPDLDTALGWAARVPNVRTGTVEVRPIRPGSATDSVLAEGS